MSIIREHVCRPRRALGVALSLFLLAEAAPGQELPRGFRQMLKGTHRLGVGEQALGSEVFHTFAPFSDLPYLLWRADYDRPAPVAKDPEIVRRWLTRVGPALGHDRFVPRLGERTTWLDHEVWRYRLELGGVRLWDAQVLVYWLDDQFIGVVNGMPGPLVDVPRPPENPGADAVYVPRRLRARRYALDLARVQRSPTGALTLRGAKGAAGNSTWVPVTPPLPPRLAQGFGFKEWPLPVGFGTFPDQIDTDSQGRVWFSQPNANQLGLFDPLTEQFTKFPVTAGNGPDGMMVSAADEVWTGLYYSGDLGRYDPVGQTHFAYPAPYSGAALAIPTETSLGTIVVTDHADRVLEFDPSSQQWIKNLKTPSSGTHIVAGVEDGNQVMWFTQYFNDSLARLDLASGSLTEITIPGGGGPAFPAYSGGRVFFSLWNRARLGAYDIASQTFTFWDYTPSTEYGGPIFAAPNGDVCLGTRGTGYVMIHEAATGNVVSYKIPTTGPGLKDGLTVGSDGTVWITGSLTDRLIRLVYPH